MGDVVLDGATLEEVELVYRTVGSLDGDGANAVLLLTSFGSTDADVDWLIGPQGALDPDRWYVVVVNMLGNGISTSPSNAAPAQKGGAFPTVTIADNVDLQRRLLFEVLGVRRLALVAGFSLGGMQAFEWAVRYPADVRAFATVCGAYRTSTHNRLMVDSVLAALEPDLRPGATGSRGRETAARVFAAWGMSQGFYRREGFQELGFDTAEDYVERYWIPRLTGQDPHDLAAMLRAWHGAGRTGANAGRELGQVLSQVTARGLLMPSVTDLYFTAEDSLVEHRCLPDAEIRPIPSDWGHAAGSGRDPGGARWVNRNLGSFLARP